MGIDVFTVDFETYYSKTYGLTKLSYQEYVDSPEFQIIMVGVKKNDEPTEVYSSANHEDYRTWLMSKDVHLGAVLCHNTLFDGIILEQILGIIPPMLLDTLALAQALLKPFHRSISLAKCLQHEDSPLVKGTYVGNMVRPKGVAVDSDGNIYVVESYHDHLLIYDSEGRFLLPIGGNGTNIGQFFLPAGAWSDSDDRIFVADMFNGRVVIFQFVGG